MVNSLQRQPSWERLQPEECNDIGRPAGHPPMQSILPSPIV